MKNGELIGEMIAWEAGEPKRINHFLKVYGFAKAIASREQLSSATMNLVETAAILHDIGIRPALEKHGSSAGALQEEEGETALVGHHHSYEYVHDIDHQILFEAYFLVNLNEKNAPAEEIQRARDNIFKTFTGKQFLEQIAPSQRQEV